MHARRVAFCCDELQNAYTNGIISVSSDITKCYMLCISTSEPTDVSDQNPQLIRTEIQYCPFCGSLVVEVSQPIPIPTYNYASVLGGTCDCSVCRFQDSVNNVCMYQFRMIGCFETDQAAKQAYIDLLASIQTGVVEMTNQ